MRTEYTHLSPQELAWKDNVRHVRRRVDEALLALKDELINAALKHMSDEFQEGLKRNEILRIGADPVKIAIDLAASAQRFAALEAGEE